MFVFLPVRIIYIIYIYHITVYSRKLNLPEGLACSCRLFHYVNGDSNFRLNQCSNIQTSFKTIYPGCINNMVWQIIPFGGHSIREDVLFQEGICMLFLPSPRLLLCNNDGMFRCRNLSSYVWFVMVTISLVALF